MTLIDATIAMGFAEKLFGTDQAVRSAAARAFPLVPAADRARVAVFINHPTPAKAIRQVIQAATA